MHLESISGPNSRSASTFPAALCQSESYTLRELHGHAAAVSEFHGQTGAASSAKIAREGKQQHRVNPRGFQQPQLFRQRSQQLQSVIGTQDARRVRLKSYNHRVPVSRPRPPNNLVNHRPMSPVYPVKIPNADDGRPEVVRDVVEFMEVSIEIESLFYRRGGTSRQSMVVSR